MSRRSRPHAASVLRQGRAGLNDRLAVAALGVTAIAVQREERTADFQIAEIIQFAERQLLGGRII